ncbi:MAG: hypothetical protein ACI8W9_001106, partial [Psychromonas sp.]
YKHSQPTGNSIFKWVGAHPNGLQMQSVFGLAPGATYLSSD